MKYYVKNKSLTVAILDYNEKTDLYSMEIVVPEGFLGPRQKVFFTDTMCRSWMDSRLTPEYQKGYEDFCARCGVDINDPKHRIKMFFGIKGANVRDTMWVTQNDSDTYEDSPHWGL